MAESGVPGGTERQSFTTWADGRGLQGRERVLAAALAEAAYRIQSDPSMHLLDDREIAMILNVPEPLIRVAREEVLRLVGRLEISQE